MKFVVGFVIWFKLFFSWQIQLLRKTTQLFFLFVFIILLQNSLAIANKDIPKFTMVVYEGKITNVPVVMELVRHNGEYRGRYFYEHIGVDIPLHGSLGSLIEAGPYGKDGQKGKGAKWLGKLSGSVYSGVWRSLDNGKEFNFSLKKAIEYIGDVDIQSAYQESFTSSYDSWLTDINPSSDTLSRKSWPYDYRKVAVKMPVIETRTFGDVSYVMLKDPKTNFAYPRLSKHPQSKVMRQVNKMLEKKHWDWILYALSCETNKFSNENYLANLGEIDNEEAKVYYLSTQLMTIIENGGVYCTGAHPNNHYDPYTIDLINGKIIKPIDMFELTEVKINEVEKELYVKERHLNKQAQKLIAKFILPDANIEDCPSPFSEFIENIRVYFESPDKVIIGLSGLPHVISVCQGDYAAIPFSSIMRILKPEAKKYFPSIQ